MQPTVVTRMHSLVVVWIWFLTIIQHISCAPTVAPNGSNKNKITWSCSEAQPCADRFFCNFDIAGTFGVCESCDSCVSCSSCELPEKGKQNCLAVCNDGSVGSGDGEGVSESQQEDINIATTIATSSATATATATATSKAEESGPCKICGGPLLNPQGTTQDISCLAVEKTLEIFNDCDWALLSIVPEEAIATCCNNPPPDADDEDDNILPPKPDYFPVPTSTTTASSNPDATGQPTSGTKSVSTVTIRTITPCIGLLLMGMQY